MLPAPWNPCRASDRSLFSGQCPACEYAGRHQSFFLQTPPPHPHPDSGVSAHRLRHLSLEPRSLTAGYPLSCEVCVGDGPSCTGKLQTCAPDEDSCIVVVTETNRSKRARAGITCWGGGGCLQDGRICHGLGEPLSDDYQEGGKGNLEVGGGVRILWNDRNHCCQGFLKMRLQREDGEVQIQTFLPKKELGKQRTWGKSGIQRSGKSNM